MAGRGKKKIISEKDMAKAEEYALQGCKNNTICTLMGWNEHFLEDRKDILKKLTKKRAERKLAIREAQFANRKQPVMSIWLGKNELGQTDRQQHDVKAEIGTRELSEAEVRELLRDKSIPCEDAIAS